MHNHEYKLVCNHLKCECNKQDLSSDATNLVELYDRPRSDGLTEVFMECDRALKSKKKKKKDLTG